MRRAAAAGMVRLVICVMLAGGFALLALICLGLLLGHLVDELEGHR